MAAPLVNGVNHIPENPQQLESIREENLHLDIGNLLAFDARQISSEDFQEEEQADKSILALGTMAVQALVEQLFSLPSTAEKIGRSVELPPPVTPLPREKPLPKPRPPTKWEKFAQTKGIVKRKRSKLEYDESTDDWRRRYGYKRVNDENEEVILEAKPGEEPGSDPFSTKKEEKKARIAKQEKNRTQNLKAAAKSGGQAALPSTVQLAATSLPIFGTREAPKKIGKETISQAASMAAVATASVGKFDKKRADEKPMKNTGKKRKFLPVVEAKKARGGESELIQSVLNRVIAKNDNDIIDINKAVSVYTQQKERSQSESSDTKPRPNMKGKKKNPSKADQRNGKNGKAKRGKR